MDDAEVVELRNRLAAAEQKAAAADEQAARVLAENKRLSEVMHAAVADVERLSKDLRTRDDELKRLRSEAARAAQEGDRLRAEVAAADAERKSLLARAGLTDALREEGKLADVLPAKDVAKAVGGLIGDLRSEIPGMDLKGGEVRLKVAFAGVGENAAMVVPSPERAAELRETMSEVVLGFDRSVEADAGPRERRELDSPSERKKPRPS